MGPSQVLNSIQYVVGCDLHGQVPSPPPIGPHLVVWIMGKADAATSKASATVKAGPGFALGREHDLGRGPYHFAPNALLPLICAGAGNKAEFGCASVKVGDCGIDGKAVSLAAALSDGLNLQLDCGEPCPAPSSLCIASFNTVYAGLTGVDVANGVHLMTIDLALTWAIGKVAGVLASALQQAAVTKLGYVLSLLGPDARFAGAVLGMGAAPATNELMKMVIGWFMGTPLGYSYTGPVPVGGHWHAPGSDAGDALDELVNGPAVAR